METEAQRWWSEHGEDVLNWQQRQGMDLWQPLGWQPPSQAGPAPSGPAFGAEATIMSGHERVQCQFFDYWIRSEYEPPTDGASKGETLDYCWQTLRTDLRAAQLVHGFTANSAEALIVYNGMDDFDGRFYTDGVGLNCLQWALVAIAVSELHVDGGWINGTGCDDQLAELAERIRDWRDRVIGSFGVWANTSVQVNGEFGVTLTPGCPDLPNSVRQAVSGALGEAEPFTNVVRINPDLCVKLGYFADLWLAAAHRLYWANQSGAVIRPSGADSIERQIQRAGRYGLSASLSVGRTLVHEMMHQTTGWGADEHSYHCKWSCCQTRVAARWWAGMASRYGCVFIDTFQGTVDGLSADGTYAPFTGIANFSTTCDDVNGGVATLQVRLDSPGSPEDLDDFVILAESIPGGCK